jgi:hypothetical protein
MIRRRLIAAAACLPLAFAALPVNASPALHVLDSPIVDQAQDVDHSVLKCKWKRVYVDGYWKRKKVCKKVWPKHKKSYGY